MDPLRASLLFAALLLAPGVAARATEAQITILDDALTPGEVAVRFGDVVRLHVTNGGTEDHGLRIVGYDVETGLLPPGSVEALTFPADRGGRYRLACIVAGHLEAGTLVVRGQDEREEETLSGPVLVLVAALTLAVFLAIRRR